MKDKLRNIKNLSKLFILENKNGFNIIDKKTKKINKKSMMFWIIVILFLGLSYISSEIINYLVSVGKPEIFLNGYFLFLEILIIIQTIMLSTNIFYFSKDIENVLHLPFKSREILIAKFNTLIFMLYGSELIFGLLPFIMYGIYVHLGILYYINLILALIIFPIFTALVLSIIMMFLMKIIKLFKNKDLMQIIISFLLIFVVMFFLNFALKYIFDNQELIENKSEEILNNINNKIININNYFLTINPIIKILQQKNIFKILYYFLQLIFINLITFLLFILCGNRFYLKQLLKANFYFKNKKNKEIKLNKKSRKNNIFISYVKKEFKLILKNPLFAIQTIYPIIIITIMTSILIFGLVPKFVDLISSSEEYRDMLSNLTFDIEAVCLILGLIQVVTLFNYTSITAFSREGKNAYIMKFLPISLYKQFIFKNVPQVLVNTICASVILYIIAYRIPAISFNYILIMFVLSFLLILINSFILTLIDLLMPKINWDSEYEILKNNKNKLLQYVLIIFNILFLVYINKFFANYNLNDSLFIFIILLILIFIIFNLIINKLKNKLFKNINN